MTGSPHVAVIGAGIVGSSIAVSLARKGCKVTVLEAASGPAEGASAKSWAWLNANRKSPAHYKELNKAGMKEWLSLSKQQKGDVAAEFPGTIYIGDTRSEDSEYPSESLTDKDICELEPELSSSYAERGGRLYKQEGMHPVWLKESMAWLPFDDVADNMWGYAYPVLAASQFLEEARQQNADIHFSSEVVGFSESGRQVTARRADDFSRVGLQTETASYEADVVVVAAGLGTPPLVEKLGVGVPLRDKEGTLTVLTQPMPRLLQHIVVTDDTFIMQRRDGEFMISFFRAAVDPLPRLEGGATTAPQNETDRDGEEIAEHIRDSVHESEVGHSHEAAEHLNASDRIAQREITRAAAICPVLKDAALGSFSFAKYPYPPDAHPIVGWLPGLQNVYVAVTHSGATLGPYLGKLVAEEVLGERNQVLEHYRPDRDFNNLSHLY